MFLVNSRLSLFSATLSSSCCKNNHRKGFPFSRSYGDILPSSLTRVFPRTLGFSPRLPVSVCGTGTFSLARSFSRQCGPLEFDSSEDLSIYHFSGLRVTDLPITHPTGFDMLFHSHAQASCCVTPSLITIQSGTGIFASCPSPMLVASA